MEESVFFESINPHDDDYQRALNELWNARLPSVRVIRSSYVLDEKAIPSSKIVASWAMGDSIPQSTLYSYLVPIPHGLSLIPPFCLLVFGT